MKDINIYAFADEAGRELETQINAMLNNNLQGLEIRSVDGENISDISLAKAKEIRNIMDANGLSVFSIGSPIGKIDLIEDDYSSHLDKFKHSLELAEILGAKHFRLFSFYIHEHKNPDEYKDIAFERLEDFVDISRGRDIILCHENEKGIYGDVAKRCLEIHRAFPEIKAVFDPANFVQCHQDTNEAWDMLKNYVEYLHIKDALSDGAVVPSGKGEGNVKRIIKEYLALGKNNMTVEPHLTVFDGLASLEKTGGKLKNKYVFNSNEEAFECACNALKEIINEVEKNEKN
ncbi:MAG: sugar phosphate isomerase/epimerase [Eubacterium sp.]|nr:sugar phosphate isomerase/epimerase [Eubacterium sp.]